VLSAFIAINDGDEAAIDWLKHSCLAGLALESIGINQSSEALDQAIAYTKNGHGIRMGWAGMGRPKKQRVTTNGK